MVKLFKLIFPIHYDGALRRTCMITAYWLVNPCLWDIYLDSDINLCLCHRKVGFTLFTLTVCINFSLYGAACVMALSNVIVVVSAQLRYWFKLIHHGISQRLELDSLLVCQDCHRQLTLIGRHHVISPVYPGETMRQSRPAQLQVY